MEVLLTAHLCLIYKLWFIMMLLVTIYMYNLNYSPLNLEEHYLFHGFAYNSEQQ